MQEVAIYTDGACRGNPGPGGYGVILSSMVGEKVYQKELSAGYRSTTNNRMEVLAAITGLEALKVPCKVKLYSDSQYLVKAFEEKWIDKWQANDWFRDKKRKEKAKNVDLWQRLLAAMEPHEVTFICVKGHAENEFNNRCDEPAVQAALNQDAWLEDKENAPSQS